MFPSFFKVALAGSALLFTVLAAQGAKIYERCELARELRDEHELPQDKIGTWVCIARYESEYNTSAINQGSGDHGLFQISQLFWCSPPGAACGVSCDSLRDDDIEDDVICARRIYRQHQRLHGDGFLAWVVYNQHCRNAQNFVDDCWTATKKDPNNYVNENSNKKIDVESKDKDKITIVDIEDEVVKVDAEECNFKSADCKKTSSTSTSTSSTTTSRSKEVTSPKERQIKFADNYDFSSVGTGFRLFYRKKPSAQ